MRRICFIKIITSLLLSLTLLFALCACGQTGAGSTPTPSASPSASAAPTPNGSPSPSPTSSSEPAPSAAASIPSSRQASGTVQTFTFQIDAELPPYDCTATLSDDGNKTQKIEITDADSGAPIQTITPPDNEVFTTSAVLFIDVTFDGSLDLLIPFQRSAHGVDFDAYVWDGTKKQFAEAPSFQDIWNPAVDSAGKRILAKDSSSQITSYLMASFENGQFVTTNSFVWQPADLDPSPVPNADTFMHCQETRNGAVVNDFYVSKSDGDIDMADAQLQPYFAAGSFWDLGGQQWQCTFMSDLKNL